MSEPPLSAPDTAPPLESAIDAACCRFEEAWEAALSGGGRPGIEDHLAGCPSPSASRCSASWSSWTCTTASAPASSRASKTTAAAPGEVG
jgi:hypothetical protein